MSKIAILTGGPGYERNIALKSVEIFKKYLKHEYDVFLLPEELDIFLEKKSEYRKVIPVFHGEYGEDGRIQAFLDILELPYVGYNYYINALCMNKREANIIAFHHGISVPKEYILKKGKELHIESIGFGYPIIAKLNTGGSSYYTYKVVNEIDLQEKIEYIRSQVSDDILIQEYILGDEYSISLVNGEILDAIMFVEKNNPEDFFDYDSKYETESGMRETFPQLEIRLKKRLIEFAGNIRDIFGLYNGYARIDVIVRGEDLYFLEVNTIPGSTEVSILPKAWKLSGRSLEEFVEEVLR
ncbi:ATP-grasp domain-containing protein [Candidatus Gracilibacteria bacterium]|nr:ATP-grasp domain-containing protein [Candidatus Gracilibacteria bacterium]